MDGGRWVARKWHFQWMCLFSSSIKAINTAHQWEMRENSRLLFSCSWSIETNSTHLHIALSCAINQLFWSSVDGEILPCGEQGKTMQLPRAPEILKHSGSTRFHFGENQIQKKRSGEVKQFFLARIKIFSSFKACNFVLTIILGLVC